MTRKGYKDILTQKDILKAFKEGRYSICYETGTVTNHKGKVVTPFYCKGGRSFVRIYYQGNRKAISVNRLVWLTYTKRPIPAGFEIHHIDEDYTNNSWNNLLCVFSKDHIKLHPTNGVPF